MIIEITIRTIPMLAITAVSPEGTGITVRDIASTIFWAFTNAPYPVKPNPVAQTFFKLFFNIFYDQFQLKLKMCI